MADRVRDDFNEVMLTLDGRIRQLPQAERNAIEYITRAREAQKMQLAKEQAQRREADIAAERMKLTGERGGPAPRPPRERAGETFQQFSARTQKQAERNIDFKNEQAIADIENQKQKDIERRVEQAEQREAEKARERQRAEELAKAAQRAREMEERGRDGHNRGR